MSVLNRAARGALCIVFAATLAGFSWGNGEADQREAFIAFLQDVNNRPGIHFLVPTANDEKAFGPYLQQYAVILDFDKDMKAPMSDFTAQIIKLGYGPNPSPRTIEQIAAAPADLTAAKDAVRKMEQVIETRLAKINADRAALKQPDDLKTVYDKTFDKLVTAPGSGDGKFRQNAQHRNRRSDRARHLHQRAPHQGECFRHADPSQGPAHIGRTPAANEGLSGRRRAFHRRATAERSGVAGELVNWRILQHRGHPEVRPPI